MSAASHSPIRKVAVIGAGTIGASWAAHFLAHGLDVVVSDPAPGAKEHTQQLIDGAWPVLKSLGTVKGDPKGWRFEPDPAKAVEGVDFVQENAPERYEVKQKLLGVIGELLPPEVVIASSSSGLLVTRFSQGCRFPERCVIGHPFNPPHLIPLVEVVGGEKASRAAIDTAMAFYAAIGKRPIEIRKEVTGHVANRLQAALWREAIYLVEQGVASVSDIDAAVTEGPGLRWALMGPHMTFNLGGGQGGLAHFMEHLLPAVESWWADLGTPNMTAELQQTLVDGVKAEADGRSMTELAQWRDKLLTDIITLRAASAEASAAAAADRRLDEALEETFPGSDAPSVTRQTPAEDIEGDPAKRG
ncbi:MULTISPECIES: 3-hydroxyacyl-CoA dehydrogenase NAD-binding domain-containing protein [unclassified Xanthobacter]|uniref:3-hydroxyacyl-CoA dehydrogenase NAD-binding domain-containing protein n=1 Tax=unclassified Xanthobacter TaxID=2623496 RepID=UPI001EDE765A|nr:MULTISPECIES: 3-hydroxyacyl-CoA dehydrogenase NAD-binding domain-containing protein [unclassified Xanthobacter]